jgi:hypothetical protein
MLLLIFAIIVFADPQARAEDPDRDTIMVLNLEQGGMLPLPSVLAHDLQYLETSADRVAIRGYSEDRHTFFLFVFNARSDSLSTLRREVSALGLDPSIMMPVTQSRGNLNPRIEIVRLEGQAVFGDHLMGIASRGNRHYAAVFLLIGPRDTFYRYTAQFSEMVDDYRVDAKAVLAMGGQANLSNVLLAIALLLANLFIIWLGFREIAKSSVSRE